MLGRARSRLARATAVGYIELRDGKAEFRPIHDATDVLALAAVAAAGLMAGLLASRLLR